MYIQSAQNPTLSLRNRTILTQALIKRIEIRNSVSGMTINWNWVIQFDILFWGEGEERGICENSRLEFGKTVSKQLKCQLLSTKKNESMRWNISIHKTKNK